MRLFAQVRTDELFHFLNPSSANSSWFMQAFLSNFLYSRRTEVIYAQGRDALLQLRDEKEKLVA